MLTNTYPRAPVEGDVGPGFGLPCEPAGGVECEVVKGDEAVGVGGRGGEEVWGVEVGAALHYEGGVADGGIGEDADGGEVVGARTAAGGEGCVFQGEADVERDGGVEAEGFVHCILFHMVRRHV